MEREQIIKALECFHQRILNTKLAEKITESEMMAIINALSLIKELTEENERLRAEISVKKKLLDKCVELEDKVKVDTVREMRSRIKARCISGGIYPAFVENVIDQIANEMLEEG